MMDAIKEALMVLVAIFLMAAISISTGLNDLLVEKLEQGMKTSTSIPRLQMEYSTDNK